MKSKINCYSVYPENENLTIGCRVQVETPSIHVCGKLSSIHDNHIIVEYVYGNETSHICINKSIITKFAYEFFDEEETIYTGVMSSDRFKELLDELDGNSLQTLKEKNARYSQNGDALHNFRSGAEIMGKTPAQACWGYMTKHLVALRDKVERNDFSDREDFLEKCQDTINYIRFLWCIGNDKSETLINSEIFYDDTEKECN